VAIRIPYHRMVSGPSWKAMAPEERNIKLSLYGPGPGAVNENRNFSSISFDVSLAISV